MQETDRELVLFSRYFALLCSWWLAQYLSDFDFVLNGGNGIDGQFRLTFLNVYRLPFNQSDTSVFLIGFFVLGLILLLLGKYRRLAGAIVFLCVESFSGKSVISLPGVDSLFKSMGLMLIIYPMPGIKQDLFIRSHFLLRYFSRYENYFRFQLFILYFGNFVGKCIGSQWRDGTAALIPLSMPIFRVFEFPASLTSPQIGLGLTYATLILELSLGFLILFKKLNFYTLACALIFHLLLGIFLYTSPWQEAMFLFLIFAYRFQKNDLSDRQKIRSG